MSENIVILMIGVSTFLGALGLIALLWGVKTGQFDDVYTPSVRMLFEDEFIKDNKNINKTNSK